jgi:hypothetical protein
MPSFADLQTDQKQDTKVTETRRARRRGAMQLASVCLLVTGAGAAQVPTAGRGSTAAREAAHPPRFEFRSNFWLNLHHFLYQQARARQPTAGREGALPPMPIEELSAEEQGPWKEALDYYAAHLAGRDLQLNGDMINIKNRMVEWEKQPDLSTSGLRAELISAMQKAAPIYRTHWWTEHERRNRAWIAAAQHQVARTGNDLGARLAAAYQARWPVGALGVDVTYVANGDGAYTTDEPLHVTISSGDARNQQEGALEILYHEASHGLTRHVREAIARECRARHKPIPRDLWHAVLLYTTREMVRRVQAEQGGRDYVPSTNRHGLYPRSWTHFQPLLERHWQAYLEGKIAFEAAIARMVSAL